MLVLGACKHRFLGLETFLRNLSRAKALRRIQQKNIHVHILSGKAISRLNRRIFKRNRGTDVIALDYRPFTPTSEVQTGARSHFVAERRGCMRSNTMPCRPPLCHPSFVLANDRHTKGRRLVRTARRAERPEGFMDAEIFISVDAARRQAPLWGHTFRQELAFLIVHGLLHLCGLRDATQRARLRMWKIQEKLIRML